MNGIKIGDPEQDIFQSPKREALPLRIQRHVWQSIARGFLLLIPLFITILILRYLVGFAGSVIGPFVDFVITRPVLEDVPGATLIVWISVTASALLLFCGLGMLVTGEKGQNRVALGINAFLSRIPVVKSIYDVANQTTQALSTPREDAFSRVVFLEWPRPGVKALGLVTGQCVLPHDDRTMLVVYIATVPNPTSGMLAVIPEDDVVDAGISVEQAMKIIFSGGIVIPEGLQETITVVNGRDRGRSPVTTGQNSC